MSGWEIDPNLPLELLNGAGTVVSAFFLASMVRYLWNETIRRKLGVRQWLTMSLPPSMNFGAAVVLFDVGVWVRSVDIWIWRRFFGAGDFNALQLIILVAGAFAIVLGGLCKVRAITRPDFGDGPWLAAAATTAAFLVLTAVFR